MLSCNWNAAVHGFFPNMQCFQIGPLRGPSFKILLLGLPKAGFVDRPILLVTLETLA